MRSVATVIILVVGLACGLGVMFAFNYSGEAATTHEGDGSHSALVTAQLEPVRIEMNTEHRPVVPDVPADSGNGKRVVYDQDSQRVWLMNSDDSVKRTYLVSGSRLENLKPGDYQVQSKLPKTRAYDYSGSMEYFVQFAHGQNAAIGFHDIPRDNAGELKQDRTALGTRLSDGCVRQWREDAVALWKFTQIGTPVVVTS